jgi:hypothetical protein
LLCNLQMTTEALIRSNPRQAFHADNSFLVNETIPLRFDSRAGKVRLCTKASASARCCVGGDRPASAAVLSGCVPWAPKERKGVENDGGNIGCARMETEDIEAGPGLRGTSLALDGVRLHRRASLRATPAALPLLQLWLLVPAGRRLYGRPSNGRIGAWTRAADSCILWIASYFETPIRTGDGSMIVRGATADR